MTINIIPFPTNSNPGLNAGAFNAANQQLQLAATQMTELASFIAQQLVRVDELVDLTNGAAGWNDLHQERDRVLANFHKVTMEIRALASSISQ